MTKAADRVWPQERHPSASVGVDKPVGRLNGTIAYGRHPRHRTAGPLDWTIKPSAGKQPAHRPPFDIRISSFLRHWVFRHSSFLEWVPAFIHIIASFEIGLPLEFSCS